MTTGFVDFDAVIDEGQRSERGRQVSIRSEAVTHILSKSANLTSIIFGQGNAVTVLGDFTTTKLKIASALTAP